MYLKDTGEFYRAHHRGRLQQIGLSSSLTESVSEVGPCYLHSDVSQVIFMQIISSYLANTHPGVTCNDASTESSSLNLPCGWVLSW